MVNLFKKSKLKQAQYKVEATINITNIKIEDLGKHTGDLYESLTAIGDLFDKIKNVPSEKMAQYENWKKVRSDWKDKAEKIETDYNKVAKRNLGGGAAGAGLGIAVVTMGPTAAMGIATTFGLASTGTAISTLSGAAATNAALAWLGGGALVAGGGGMAAGNAFRSMAGPVGWAIAAISLVASGLLLRKNSGDKKRLENLFISISNRDVKSYELAIIEIIERINRIIDETNKLNEAINLIKSFGLDYNIMTEKQKYTLGSYVNLMNSSTQLLTNPIINLEPKFTEVDFDTFINSKTINMKASLCNDNKALIISLANLLYKIEIDEKTKILLWKSLKKNKEMLKSMSISKKELDIDLMNIVFEALEFIYQN